jgi:hypothetical protein
MVSEHIVNLGTVYQSYYTNLIEWSIQIIFLLPEPIHALLSTIICLSYYYRFHYHILPFQSQSHL